MTGKNKLSNISSRVLKNIRSAVEKSHQNWTKASIILKFMKNWGVFDPSATPRPNYACPDVALLRFVWEFVVFELCLKPTCLPLFGAIGSTDSFSFARAENEKMVYFIKNPVSNSGYQWHFKCFLLLQQLRIVQHLFID